MDSSSRVFAAVQPAAPGPGLELAPHEKEQRPAGRAGTRLREVQVTGAAEVSCPADRVSVRVTVSSSKEAVSEVTNSVSRRLEYILQAVRMHGISEQDTSVRKFLHRDADQYRMDAEVLVTFSDFDKMERVSHILLEKLDKSVCIGMPQFHHSAECLDQVRRRACVSAVENAQQKAREVIGVLGQSLGPPLLIREEETREWRNEEAEEAEEEEAGRGRSTAAPPHLPRRPTITASSRVSVSFSLRDRRRKNL